MPTYEIDTRCRREFASLSLDEKRQFRKALKKFLEDLPTRRFRASLRIRDVEGYPGVWEMTWSGDGRATFEYGQPIHEGESHVLWRRIGGHEIFQNP